VDRKQFRSLADWFYIVGGPAALVALAYLSHGYVRWFAMTGFAVLVFVIALVVSGALLDQRRLDKQFGNLDQHRIRAMPHRPADDHRFSQILYEPNIRPGFLASVVNQLSQKSEGSFFPSAVSDREVNEQRWTVEFTSEGKRNQIAVSVSEGWVEYHELLLGINKAIAASGRQFLYWEDEDCIWAICLADTEKTRLSKEGWQFG